MERNRARVEPAIGAVVTAQAELQPELGARCDCLSPSLDDAIPVRRMQLLLPAVAELRDGRYAGVVEPLAAEVVAIPFRSARPHKLRQ